MSNLGVFHWIRDAVRRSVLLGFSDAVEQLGGPGEATEPLNTHLLAALRHAGPTALPDAPTIGGNERSQRKRLGRSLEQLRQQSAKTVERAS